MRFAICQSEIKYLDFEHNLKYAEKAIHEAACNDADCIVFPEMSFTGFSMNTELTSKYSTVSLKAIKSFAITYNITIGFGWTEMQSDNLSYNHYSFISSNGDVILDYIKIHPFSYAGENLYFKGGTSLPYASMFDLDFQCAICYDLRFPEIFRINPDKIQAVIVPANWPEKRLQHWKILIQARAIENQIYIIGVNCTGIQDGLLYSGGSMVVSPDGSIICDCGNEPGIYYADVNPMDVKNIRKEFPVLNDIRKELYNNLSI